MKEAIDAALTAQDWPRAQTLIGVAAELALQPADAAWLTLFKAEMAWGEGNLPLVHRRIERLCAQPDLPPDLAERLAADLERWFHFAPEMTPDKVAEQDQRRVVWMIWYAQRRSTPALQATALLGLGEAALMQARYADAERHYQAALAVYRQIAYRLGEAHALRGLGEAARMQDRFADVRGYLVQAFDLYEAIAMPRETLVFAISNANAALDQIESGAAPPQAHRQQAADLARWLLVRAEQANLQCAPAIAAASAVRLQALRLRIANL